MSGACPSCGAGPARLPVWLVLVPPALGAVSYGAWRLLGDKLPVMVVVGAVTLAFVGFSAYLFVRLRSILSGACPRCGGALGG